MLAPKSDFPLLADGKIAYLDNAATTQRPKVVIDAIVDFYANHNANIHRGLYPLARESTEIYEGAHRTVAEFIGGKMEETVFVRNASEGLNLAAHVFGQFIEKGDRIVVTLSEHHSNLLPWWRLARERGAELILIHPDETGVISKDRIEEELEKGAKLVAIQHASNVTGAIYDIASIAKTARRNGAYVVVDGAQSVPHVPVDVAELRIDALAFSAHKMLGPTGIGAVWIREDILNAAEPFLLGGDMIKSVSYRDGDLAVEWNDLPWKFEAGTPNIAGAAGFAAAVEYLSRIGMERILRHEQELLEPLVDFLEERSIPYLGPRDVGQRGGIVAFNVPGKSPYAVAAYLGTQGICVRAGYHCAQPLHEVVGTTGTVRASVYVYNDSQDIERLITALEGII